MRLIVGLTGAFGSGCTFIAQNYFVREYKYKSFSLSKKLREEYVQDYHKEPTRHELQEYGNEKRKEDQAYLAKAIFENIKSEPGDQPIVIDSIRNPAEILFFREVYPEFLLIAIFADYDVRWDRVKTDYSGSKDNFDKDEIKDQGNYEPVYGQKISTCFFEADLIISNNDSINVESHNAKYNEMNGKLKNYVEAFSHPTSSSPTVDETLMAMAYAIGRRSKCIKRRVGAVIVDNKKCVLSTGFNAVPIELMDCKEQIGDCYRDQQRIKLKTGISQLISDSIKQNEDKQTETSETLPGEINDNAAEDKKIKEIIDKIPNLSDDIVKKIKILELCRALHAEENAILNLVGRSVNSDLSGATLYATTFPCNLCANKIVQIGIKKVVYFEPYPVKQAKEIFESGKVNAEPFEGVTFRAFFRAFNYEP